MFMPVYEKSDGADGFVCAQVNPSFACDRDAMRAMAKRFALLGPNIAVKLPANEAGLWLLEECIAEGITVTATVSFTVPQVIAIAERHLRGMERAEQAGVRPGRCFAVIMIGRIDDYLKDVERDNQIGLDREALEWAGLAIVKRAYRVYRERRYPARLCIAALRGTAHMTELAGAAVTMSIHPRYQDPLFSARIAKEERIEAPVPPEIVETLCRIPDFVRAYEPEGMGTREFVSFGLFQRTITQFSESGWKLLESRRHG